MKVKQSFKEADEAEAEIHRLQSLTGVLVRA